MDNYVLLKESALKLGYDVGDVISINYLAPSGINVGMVPAHVVGLQVYDKTVGIKEEAVLEGFIGIAHRLRDDKEFAITKINTRYIVEIAAGYTVGGHRVDDASNA